MKRKFADANQLSLDWNAQPELVTEIPEGMGGSTRSYPAVLSALELARMEVCRLRARSAVAAALKAGTVKRPENCERCLGPGPLSSHHEDYGKPLDVQWLCDKCHRKRTRQIAEQARASLPTAWKDGFRGTPSWALKAIKRGAARTHDLMLREFSDS
jgi:ribosomal protein S27AE